jgi:hypothetical protein
VASQKASVVSPRLLRRERAAAYLDISAGSFDKLVRDGVVPPAKVLHSFKVWDRADLDALADALPYENGNDAADTSWDD